MIFVPLCVEVEPADAAPGLGVPAPQPAAQPAGPAPGQGGLPQQGTGGQVPQVTAPTLM